MSYLQAHPDTKYVYVPIGDLATGLPEAMAAAGIGREVKIVGGVPNVDQIQSLIDGTTDAWMALPRVSAAWQMVDAMARYDQGMDVTVSRSVPARPIYTPDNVPSPAEDYAGVRGLRGPVEGAVGGQLTVSDTTTTEELTQTMRQLLERQAIVDLLLRYASTIDAKDYTTLRSLFSDDIHARYGDVVVDGGDELLAWIDGMTADATWQHHMLNVYHVDFVSETEAKTLTYHTSHQTASATPNTCRKIVARYYDTVRKVDGAGRSPTSTCRSAGSTTPPSSQTQADAADHDEEHGDSTDRRWAVHLAERRAAAHR